MAKPEAQPNGMMARLWLWLKDQMVKDVPPETALCEFDCRKPQCLEGEWGGCERRLSQATGELMPDRTAESKPTEPR